MLLLAWSLTKDSFLFVLGCSEPNRTSGQDSVAHTRSKEDALDPSTLKLPAHTYFTPALSFCAFPQGWGSVVLQAGGVGVL